MKEFLAILKARNIEFYRDKGAMGWSFVFPLLIILGCYFAFSKPEQAVFKVGLHGSQDQFQRIELLQQDYAEVIPYPQLATAQKRIQHHQLDLLISTEQPPRYWVNPNSSRSLAVETLLATEQLPLQKQQLSGSAVRYVDWVMPGVLGMNLMFGALFGVGYVIVRYRRNGVLKRLQATPISALQFVSAQMTSRMIIVVAVNMSIFIGCNWLLDLLVLGSYFNLLLILLLGALSMIALGLMVASRTANEELAGGLLNVSSWPMLFLSDVWFSMDNAPPWMQVLADFLPLTHIVQAARAVMVDNAGLMEISHHLLWLTAMTAVFLLVASLLFRWNEP